MPLPLRSLRCNLIPALATASLLTGPSARAAGTDCDGYGSLKDNPKIESGRIIGGDGKTPFIKGGTDGKGCPASGAACARKTFVVPGDRILISGRRGDFACSVFVNAIGRETDGWLPAADIAVDPSPSATNSQSWTGAWIRDEAKIVMKPAPDGKLAIEGDATLGIHDPQKVRHGLVNIGEIAGTIGITGDRLSFTMGDKGDTLPIDKGDEEACKVWMRRVGAYLLVDDNGNCGGLNVSFTGTYVRRP